MNAFRIGKLLGADIRLDWSWLFIFVLMTWNLLSIFSRWHPDWPPAETMAVALAASLLFFACLLAHELAHSLVAMRFGLRVRSITLFLFGGVSNIEHEMPSAKAEFWTAVVGPMTSIVLGLGFIVTAQVATAVSFGTTGTSWTGYTQLGPLETLLAWLGPINLLIGVFNLIPAFPLDGGRVFRSLLWAISRNLRASTRWVSAVGQLFGWLFIVAGIAMTFGARVPLFGTGLGGGLWLAFIGWFLRSAASQSYRRLAIDDALAGHTVDELMRTNGPTVPPDLSLTELVRDYLVRSDERVLPVVRDGELLGLVSVSDMRAIPHTDWPTTQVATVMRPRSSLALASPQEPLAEAFEELTHQDVGHLPVINDGRLVGILQQQDIARWLQLGA